MTLTIRPGVTLKPGITVAKPLPPASYSLTSVANNVNEGTALTFNVATTAVPDGTTLWWSAAGGGANMSFGRFSSTYGSVTVVGGAASFSITISADNLTSPDQQLYQLILYKDGRGGLGGIEVDRIVINVNDTSLTRPQWHDGDATASGASVSYRYYKFRITKIRDVGQSFDGATQISELIILNGSTKLTGGTATNPGGTQAFASQGPSKVLTGYYDDKWCDTAASSNGYSTLIIDYTTAQTSNGFTFATADDVPGRDPVQWTFEGSNDGSTWTVIHEQFADATITTSRNTLVSTVFNYPTHGSAVINRAEGDYLSVAQPSYTAGGAGSGAFYGAADQAPIFKGSYPQPQPGWTAIGNSGGGPYRVTLTSVTDGGATWILNWTPQFANNLYKGQNWTLYDPAAAPFNLGTTWTIEFWLYMNGPSDSIGGSGIQGIVDQGGWYYGLPNNSMLVGLAAGKLTVCQGTSTDAIEWFEPTPQQWVHVAVVNNSGTQRAYYNGIEQVKVSDNGRDGNYTNIELPVYIGSLAPAYGSPLSGKLTNLRITNTAVYTANFYPPTTLPTKIAGTRLLWTPTDQELATDTSDSASVITNNGASYSSSYPAVNSTRGSAVFDGATNRYYRVTGGSHFQLGTTWTIEWWQKSTAATAGNGNIYTIMCQSPGGARLDIFYQSGNLVVQNTQVLCAEPAINVWVHVAIVNNAGSGTVYYNGVAQGATGNFGNYGQTQDLYIGKRGNNSFQFFNGKLTNIRILDSAYYGSDFFPDQLPAAVAGHTKLLLRPTVDTIYGVDEGNLNLAIASSGATYSSDYAPVKNTYTARTWDLNDGYAGGYGTNAINVKISDYPDIVNVPNGATIVLTGQTSGTFTVGSGHPSSQAITEGGLRKLVRGLDPDIYNIHGGDNLTITWYT